jgi:cell division protein FtsL
MLKKILLIVIIGFLYQATAICQINNKSSSERQKINPEDTIPKSLSEIRFLEKYNRNIKKSRINGVYIPKDLEDAFKEIKELASKESIYKFKQADKEFVVKRLHFGLGRWIMHNWNFYDGSRISHHIKSYGVSHPDDQVKFLLIAFHNHLNNKDLNLKNISIQLSDIRKKERKARVN